MTDADITSILTLSDAPRRSELLEKLRLLQDCNKALQEKEAELSAVMALNDTLLTMLHGVRTHNIVLEAVVEAALNLYDAYDDIKRIRDSESIPAWDRLRLSLDHLHSYNEENNG